MPYNPYAAGANMPQIPQPNGWAGKMSGMAANNQNMLVQLGGVLLDKRQNNNVRFTDIGQQAMQGRQADQERQARNMTVEWLMKNKGLDEASAQAAVASPVVLKSYLESAERPNSYQEFQLAQGDPAYAAHLQGQQGTQSTDDIKELSIINAEREKAGMPPYRLDEWITTRAKAGATGIQLPAEVGARIGLGDQFASEAPALREKIAAGALSSPQARAQLSIGIGEPTEIWRRMETGKEALVRNLTGAGMAQAEAENQAARYTINPLKDDQETMLQKLDGLLRDLEATKQGAIGARRGDFGTTGETPPQDVDPQDWQYMTPEQKALFQ